MELLTWARAQWDRIAAVAALLAGVVALLLGWAGVSRSAYPAEQLSFVVSGGLFGLFALGVGATLWLSADLRDDWRKLDRVEELLGDIAAGLEAGAPLDRSLTNGRAARAQVRS